MKCSEYVKSKGIKSLAYLSEKSSVPVTTLQDWYKGGKKLVLLDVVIDGVIKRDEGLK